MAERIQADGIGVGLRIMWKMSRALAVVGGSSERASAP
jgi:hypothetical protein